MPAPAAAPPAGVTATPPTVLPIPAHGTHLVQRGETLYRIALTYGLDMHALAAWNGMSVNQTLREGQLLRLTPPPAGLVQTAPAAPAPAPLIGQPLPAPAPAPPPAAAPAPSQAPPAVLEPSPPSMARPVEPPTRREPRALRLPYSDSALAEMQREARAQSVEPSSAVSTAPATPASAPSARSETTAGQGPEVRPGPVFERDGIRWTWPTTGRVVTAFNERAPLKGIEIAAPVGTAVVAAATGKVIFIGNELRGCGQMIVISHGEGVVSIYCHVGKVSVREQQRVTLGQKIAEVSDTHNGRLHFEVRKQGRPLDPVALMPR
ncbi:MAG: LysM peptidoglycan-binding domain-containing M23 family metallopeptidase [Casimicrobiaceae bacterium]|nr:LysM peptidoglycan-binding domain-containing M23 family metallopeptidase [Casimicrobiaceae bacterium]MCX8098615.1 LysM peptidoglycan-binding domain-containing M23 family metallopeptidase [Casimicrobiaceae bacterium]MDW8312024.1 M23 family metallopeptidase [Burkholderiales bacterium]